MNRPLNKQFLSIYIPDFSAQILACRNSDLWKQPYVITRQNTDNDRATVICVSPFSRNLGIYPGMPVHKVRMRYRSVKILKENIELQQKARKEILRICNAYTPEVHTRIYRGLITLDLTGVRAFWGHRYGMLEHHIQRQIKEQIGFRMICMGSADNAFISALYARSARPGQTKKCEPKKDHALLAEIRAELLPNLSKEIRHRLRNMNIKTVGDLRSLSRNFLVTTLGREGEKLYGMARGIHAPKKKIQHVHRVHSEVVFPVNTNDLSKLHAAVHFGADQFTFNLRQYKVKTDRLIMTITFSDNKTTQQTHQFGEPTWKFSKIHHAAMKLFSALFIRRVAIQRIEMISRKLFFDDGQLDLFVSSQEKKHRRIAEALDKIRCLFGFNAIQNADVVKFSADDPEFGS